MNLCRLLKGRIQFKIVSFFHENPASIDTPRGIATWTGETKQNIKRALAQLARYKLLTAHKVSSTTGYSYTRDPKLIKAIDSALKKLKKGGEGMRKGKLFVLVLVAVFCTSAFVGCATTPKKDLEEKDAVIQDLNNRIADMSREIETLKDANQRLEGLKADLEAKLTDLERAAQQKKAAPQAPSEPNLK